MATATDPATELADIAARLEIAYSSIGFSFLADQFGVEGWSSEFYRIVTCILERADQVQSIVEASTLDDKVRIRAVQDIQGFKTAFAGNSLMGAWNTSGNGLTIMSTYGVRLSYLQQTVRPVVQYPKLTEEEVQEFIELIDAYLAELEKSDDAYPFVRQAIRDGLTAFRFQLQYTGWMGSGYLLSAFQSVVQVANDSYQFYAGQDNCDPDAMLSMMAELVTKFKDVVGKVKPYTEAASYAYSGFTLAKTFAMPLLASHGLMLSGPTG